MTVESHLGRLLSRLAGDADTDVEQVLHDLARSITQQHSCLDLSHYDNRDDLTLQLSQLDLVSNDGTSPLVLDDTRLYLQRYFTLENEIATRLLELNATIEGVDDEFISRKIDEHFGDASPAQKHAGVMALSRRLVVITGGPGTGKTSTIVRILRALSDAEPTLMSSIALAAPTGKAAMRMAEAINQTSLPNASEVQTIHRLLGMRRDGRSYRHDRHNPVTTRLVILDEASMIDLGLMHHLLESLPDDARLILLGDPDQLPAVETGNILADVCKYSSSELADAICRLEQNYRFDPDRGIGRFSRMIREGTEVREMSDDEVTIVPVDRLSGDTLCAYYKPYIDALSGTPEEIVSAFESVRVLAPLREGDHGVEFLNRAIETQLQADEHVDLSDPWYHGRPVIVTRNDYRLRLFNGDIGICIRDSSRADPMVLFRREDGSLQSYPATRLPPHETCFSMTVHKSQGSEFEHVVLALPASPGESGDRIMTRSLLYTAVTRARTKVTIHGTPESINKCIGRLTPRQSGLGERLLPGRDSLLGD
jgi:exodeoxyribonuclease V alpha subunit